VVDCIYLHLLRTTQLSSWPMCPTRIHFADKHLKGTAHLRVMRTRRSAAVSFNRKTVGSTHSRTLSHFTVLGPAGRQPVSIVKFPCVEWFGSGLWPQTVPTVSAHVHRCLPIARRQRNRDLTLPVSLSVRFSQFQPALLSRMCCSLWRAIT